MGKTKSKKPTLTVDDRIQMCALKHSEIYDRTRNNPKFKYFLEWLDNNANTFLREINRTVKSKYARYNRGQVVMVRFGIGIDTELSGDHLAIVLTKNDNPNSGSITLIPLTSTKKANHISAGYHIWDKLLEQIDIHKSKIRKRAKQLNEEFPPTLAEFSQVVKESRLILELCGLPKLVINKAHEEIINETKKDNFVYKFCEIIENSIFSRIKDVKETEDIIEAKRSLIDKTKNVDKDLCAFFRKFDEVESFISKLENTIEKYRNKNKESFIIINSISTVSKTKILKPINECDPLNFLKVGDDILNRIDVAIIDKLTNSTSVDR